MENPFHRPAENQLRLPEVPGLNLNNIANPPQRLVADAIINVAVGKTKVVEEQRALLGEDLLTNSATAILSASAMRHGGSLLGSTRYVSMGLSRIGADAGLQTLNKTAGISVHSSWRMAQSPSVMSVLKTTALITAGNYGLDQALRSADPNADAWYSLRATESRPYNSTIFAPTLTESAGYGAALMANRLNGRARLGVMAGSWVLGRVSNLLE